jgi:hypothetical protein
VVEGTFDTVELEREINGNDEGVLGEEDEPPNEGMGDASVTLTPDAVETPTLTEAKSTEDTDKISVQGPHPIVGEGGGITRSGRRIKVTERARESQYQRGKKWVAWIASALSGPELSPKLKSTRYLLSRNTTYRIKLPTR